MANPIVYAQLENMLGLTEAEIRPGMVTLIEGQNGAGKSAWIDGMMAAFTSKGLVGEVVTQGAEKGRVWVKLQDGTSIRATFDKNGKATRTVTTAAGDTKRAPQSWLDELFGSSVVNPVQFIGMTTAEKRKVMLAALPIHVGHDDLMEWFERALPVDTDQHGLVVLEQCGKLFYEDRREANSKVKGLKNELEVVEKEIPAGFDAGEWESVDTSSLTGQLQDIGRIEAEKRQKLAEADRVLKQGNEWQAKSQSLLNDAASVEREIDRLKKRQDELKDEAVQLGDNGAAEISAADDLKEEAEAIVVPDKSAIEQKLADYSQAQRVLQQIANKERLAAQVKAAQAEADELDKLVELARQKPKELLKQVEFPVDGLEFTDDDILVNGLSIDSLSDGEKLKLGVAIAKATKGELGFICVDGAEALDGENLKWLLAQADEDNHFIITRVSDGPLTVKVDGEIGAETEAVEVDERQTTLFSEEN